MAENSQSRMERRKQKKQKKKPAWKNFFRILGLIILLSGLGVSSLFTYYIFAAPQINNEALSDPPSTKLLDVNGEVFANLGVEKRTKISYDDLPPVLIDAVIATEDARFFDHIGIDFRRIGAAVIANINSGFGAEGASTITQQVVKGSFLSPEKTLKRKIQEQWLAIRLDSMYPKKEILEMYLNKIYYGNVYGVAEAAEYYFGKEDLSELTLPEAALLAGLPQRPSAYDPTKNPDLAKERMDTVLSLMVQHGKISQQEADEAREVSIDSMLVDSRPDSTPYMAFIQQVEKEVKERTGADIYSDGLKVYTTLDPNAQQQVEHLLSDSEDNPIRYPNEDFQAGLTVLDTKTGAIRAIGGSRGNQETRNYAIGNGRQPGSTFKPITVYGPAIENLQWSTYHQINDDGPYNLGEGRVVENWNLQHPGWMSIRTALADSMNVPALKTLEEVGIERAQKFAEGIGIKFANGKMETGDAIGGTETSVTPLALAGAYSAFGNEGIYHEPFSVTKVEFSNGRTIELTSAPKVAMHEYTAYMVTDMLKSAVDEGTAYAAKVPGLPMAGKTGTTNYPEADGSPDSWFSGYTTNYTIAVWTGYENYNTGLHGRAEKVIAQNLFRETMARLSEGIETPNFSKPDSVVEVEVERGTHPAKLPSKYTPRANRIKELFVQGHEPAKTSQKFDQLDAVSGLKASYNTENQAIDVSWNYNKGENRPISFEVSAGAGGSLTKLATTKEKSLEIASVEPGTTYTVQVVAVSDRNSGNRSSPASISVKVPKEEIREEEPETPEETEQQEEAETPEEAEQQEQKEDKNKNNKEDNEGNENGNGNGNNDNNQGTGDNPIEDIIENPTSGNGEADKKQEDGSSTEDKDDSSEESDQPTEDKKEQDQAA